MNFPPTMLKLITAYKTGQGITLTAAELTEIFSFGIQMNQMIQEPPKALDVLESEILEDVEKD